MILIPKALLEPASDETLTRPKAWTCFLVNQLAFPGVGTLMAGRRIGIAQAFLMLVGFTMTLIVMVLYSRALVKYLLDPYETEGNWQVMSTPYFWIGIAGLALSAIAWFWALLSSISILGRAAANESKPPVIPPAATGKLEPRDA